MAFGTQLFIYGSLLDQSVWRPIVSRRVISDQAILKGFQRVKLRGEPYPGLRRQSDGEVIGRVVYGLNRRDILQLDQYEGEMYLRQRVTVLIQSECGSVCSNRRGSGRALRTIPCIVYAIRPEYRRRITRIEWPSDNL